MFIQNFEVTNVAKKSNFETKLSVISFQNLPQTHYNKHIKYTHENIQIKDTCKMYAFKWWCQLTRSL